MTSCPGHASVADVVRMAHMALAPLIAIDGLPCSGKTTLAERLRVGHGFDCVWLDEFVRPPVEWPSCAVAFPFEFVRYGAFLDAVRTLAATGSCRYRRFDFATLSVSERPRTVTLDRQVVVEGVSALHPGLYGLRVFIESDRATTLEAVLSRDGGAWAEQWRDLFLPSGDLYMRSRPELRTDLALPGWGVA